MNNEQMDDLIYKKTQEFVSKWESALEAFENEENDAFDLKAFKNETRELGEFLNEIGGFDLMLFAHDLYIPLSMKRIVELHWGYIGDWRP